MAKMKREPFSPAKVSIKYWSANLWILSQFPILTSLRSRIKKVTTKPFQK